jgi:hypothetical protein
LIGSNPKSGRVPVDHFSYADFHGTNAVNLFEARFLDRETKSGQRSPREVRLSRIVCHMNWAVDGRSHVDTLVAFESHVIDVRITHRM